MSEPLLNVMKIMLLLGLYLFFVRVLWSVFSELRDPRSVVRKSEKRQAAAAAARTTARRQAPSAPVAQAPMAPAPMMVAGAGVATAVATGQLRVLDPPQLIGTVFPLGSEITLGRALTNGIVLDDTYVSTVHARIFVTNGGYFIEDLASRNGSTLNGDQIVATTALVPGDRVQLGATTMEFS